MAIYYIDPHKITAGNGAWANQFPAWTNTGRIATAAGDEYRIKGVALANLLTATTYTANYTNSQTLTLTAGGSLGADFAAYDVIWLPGMNSFQKIASVTGNALTFAQMVCWSNTANQTGITLRKVDTINNPAGNTALSYGASNATTANVSITDCWIADGTRVTDGTVKSLFNSTSTQTTIQFQPDGSSVTYNMGITTGRTYSLDNTHFVALNSANSAMLFFILCSNVTCNVGSIVSGAATNPITLGSAAGGLAYLTLNIGTLVGAGPVLYGSDLNVTVSNIIGNVNLNIQPNTVQTINSTVTYGNITTYTGTGSSGSNTLIGPLNDSIGIVYNINGTWDHYTSTPNVIAQGYGNYVINWGPSFALTGNRRATNITSMGQRWIAGSLAYLGTVRRIPDIPVPPGWSTPSVYMNATGSPILTGSTTGNTVPNQGVVSCPTQIVAAQRGPGKSNYTNTVYMPRDGTDSYEVLGIYTSVTSVNNPSYGNAPVAFTTTNVVRTTGPALQILLSTRSTAYWQTVFPCYSTKTFKMPVTANTTYTVSGYIRTDIATYATADCKVRVMQYDVTSLANQNITTACINSWENFSMSITPTITGEATFCMDMYYAAAGNFYLDDFSFQ